MCRYTGQGRATEVDSSGPIRSRWLFLIKRSRGSWPCDAPPTGRKARWHCQVRLESISSTTFDGAVLGATAGDLIGRGGAGRQTAPVTPRTTHGIQRPTFLAERLRVALFDLCASVPDSWIQPTPKGLVFETLTARQAGRLVSSLEAAARALEDTTGQRSPDVRDSQRITQIGGDL